MTKHGTIKKMFRTSGFIIPDGGGVDVYLHQAAVPPDTFARLTPGQRVAFEAKLGSRGTPEVTAISLEQPQLPDPPPVTPDPPIAPVAQTTAANQEPTPTSTAVEAPAASTEQKDVPESEEVEETEESAKRSQRGKVMEWRASDGFGFIAPPTEGERGVFVHFSEVVGKRGQKQLFEGEIVLFDLGQDGQGRPCARNVRPTPEVSNGRILKFDEDLEQGEIQPNEGGEPLRFTSQAVLDKDLSEYEEGDLVKYRLAQADSGPIPVRITRLVDPRLPLQRFADLSDFDRLLTKLANPRTGAAPEEWNYRIKPSSFPYPILENYLHYTFKRIEQENKIGFGKNRRGEPIACFNTGLATPNQEEIYAFFTKAKRKRSIVVSKSMLAAPEWVLEGFFRGTEGPMIDIPKMPELASYFEGTSFKNLVFDHSLDFRIRKDHILRDRLGRFLDLPNLPTSLRDDPDALADRFDTALNLAKRRVRRNYKTAIPTFNRGKINMLLPLCIVSKDQADLALLVERKSDYDGKIDYYIGWTVLTLDMAYNNARLLARPDMEWLTP